MESGPQRTQTIERHEAIFQDYLNDYEKLRVENPDYARTITFKERYERIGDIWKMDSKTIGKIVCRKLREKSRCR